MEAVRGPSTCADPVFVLCAGRSGSTLLRFLLDSHPALACPPETRIPWLCTQMVSAWSVLEGASAGAHADESDNSNMRQQSGEPAAEVPPAVVAGLRQSFDPMIASFLAHAGKERYCDKSLGGAMHSGLLKRMWPESLFISLYRHPMDIIGSGIEASPWGLSGYGFEGYAAGNPGNSVAALARYWVDYTAEIVAAEDRLGRSCLRLRYEDLVAEPEAEAKRLFGFLGVPEVPGITETLFSRQRQRTGPGDHKIWQTTRIGGDSVGRGWDVPARLIPPPLLTDINGLAGRIGYLPVGPDWGQGDKPEEIRICG
ncbi:MAG: sulfotransferase family protein [Trebonia sp.]